jgi:hypothetical protein
MTDTHDPEARKERLLTSLVLSDEADAAEAAESERLRKIAEGRLLNYIDRLDLTMEQLTAVTEFVTNGAEFPATDADLRKQLDVSKTETANLQRQVDQLAQDKKRLETAKGKPAVIFDSPEEKDKAEQVLSMFRNGDGKLIPDAARQARQLYDEHATATHAAPSGPTSPPAPPTSSTTPAPLPGADDSTSSTPATPSISDRLRRVKDRVAGKS